MATPVFLDYFFRKLSWHYVAGIGEDFFGVLAAELDGALAATREAVRQRLLEKCKDEALPHIAENFNVEYPRRFDAERARLYLARNWERWEEAGT